MDFTFSTVNMWTRITIRIFTPCSLFFIIKVRHMIHTVILDVFRWTFFSTSNSFSRGWQITALGLPIFFTLTGFPTSNCLTTTKIYKLTYDLLTDRICIVMYTNFNIKLQYKYSQITIKYWIQSIKEVFLTKNITQQCNVFEFIQQLWQQQKNK